MGSSDLIAIYGAFLATTVAIVQFFQWKKSREIFSIKLYNEFADIGKSDLEFTITNVTTNVIEIHYVWVGRGYLPWLTPWRRKHLDLRGALIVGEEGVGNQVCYEKIAPGEMIAAYFKRGWYSDVNQGWHWSRGFGSQICIWIEHSRDSKSYFEVLR